MVERIKKKLIIKVPSLSQQIIQNLSYKCNLFLNLIYKKSRNLELTKITEKNMLSRYN